MRRLLLGLVILAIAAGTCFAHGTMYRPPNGEVPPNMRKPTDPPPPNENPTPTPPPDEGNGTPTPGDTPGDRGAPPPIPPPSGDGTGAGAVGPKAPAPAGNGAGASTPRGRGSARPPITYDSWLFWWEFNDDEILNFKARLKALENTADTTGGLLRVGRTHARGPSSKLGPTEIMIESRILPVLEAALAPGLHQDIRTAAVIALGKVGSTRPDLARHIAPRLITLMRNASGKNDFTVEESAALALGLLQTKDEQVLAALRGTLLDRKVRTRTRAFAALSLGLLRVRPGDEGHADVADALRKVLASDEEAAIDVGVCALAAMGLSDDPGFRPDLIALLRTGRAYGTRKMPDLAVSYAASALGKLAASCPSAELSEITDVLRKAVISSGTHTMRSAVIALGEVGCRGDLTPTLGRQIVRMLAHLSRKGEPQAGAFAAAALGRIGGATDDAALRTLIFETLRDRMTKGDYNGRPFGALGLGLMGRHGRADETLRQAVRTAFDEYKGDARNRGAYALALGMLGDPVGVPGLIRVLEDRGEVKILRGAAAVGLGLIGDQRASAPVRRVLVEDSDPTLRGDCAMAAGLIGSREVIPELIAILGDARTSLYVQGSTALALGRLGDRRAVEPLITLANDEKAQDLTRALAVVALGLLGDRNDLPVLSRLARDVNYRAQVDAITEVLTIL